MSIATEIYINALPSTVWSVLTNFKAYQEWNPFLQSISGNLAVGERLKARVMGIRFSSKVVVCERNKRLEWIGHFIVPGLFDGHHQFEVIEQEGGTWLKHGEDFKGFLLPLFRKKLLSKTKAGFEAMNKALKRQAEAQGQV